MATYQYIGDVPQVMKTAEHLSACRFAHPDDFYYQNLQAAARVLLARGKGACRYITQYLSGTTNWEFNGRTILVKENGEVVGDVMNGV